MSASAARLYCRAERIVIASITHPPTARCHSEPAAFSRRVRNLLLLAFILLLSLILISYMTQQALAAPKNLSFRPKQADAFVQLRSCEVAGLRSLPAVAGGGISLRSIAEPELPSRPPT